ncbi:hypothetical protein CRG98_020419 [Punica granatum]|uniref:G-patch domain-containing protein n=1 Tax=Punica granatum TaxID=22663 RepID=A0A2I0JTG7_PUNGR|nr:hypothetical protein CRG98_020419 [Punica granatum]
MEESIRALQSGDARLDARYGDCSLFPGMRLPPKFKIPEFKTYEGTTDPRHHLRHYRGKMLQYWEYEEFVIHSFQDSLSGSALDWFMSLRAEDVPTWGDLSRKGVYYSHLLAHTSSFSDLIEAGKKLDLGIKLGRMEEPTNKGEDSSKKVPATSPPSGRRRGKEVSVNTVNTTHQAPQQYSMNFTSAPPATPSYTPHYQPSAPRATQPTQRVPPPQGQQDGAAQSRPRRQYPALPVPLSHIYRQVRDKIGTIVPGPNFDPTIQDQSKQCEYHRGAPGYTLDNCWRLRERIQGMIEAKELVFNAGNGEQGCPSPFVIEYVPAEVAVGFTGAGAPPAPFVIDIPAREPYSDDKVPWTYEGGCAHFRALHIVCKCNNHIVGRVMKDNGSMLNVCPVTTLKQINVDLNRIRHSKTTVRAFDGSRREVNGEIDLLIDIGPASHSKCWISRTPSAYSLEGLGSIRPAPFRPRFIRSVGDDENLPFHSFETISVIRDFGEVGPSHADCMIGKVLLRHNYIPGTGLGARGQGINRPIEVEVYKHRRGLGFRPSCHEIIEARRGNHLHRLATHYGVHIRPAQENEELNNWTSVLHYSAVIADVLHSNPNLRRVDSNPSEECLGEPGPIYFGEGLDEDSLVPEIEESLRRLEDRQLTSLEPTEEINVGTEEEPRVLKIGMSLDPTQRARMIDFLTRSSRPSGNNCEQRASLLLRIKEEVVKQINAGFLEVCNYSEWVANIVRVEKKDGRVRVCVDYRDLNKASPKDNFPLPHIDILVDNTARHAQFSFMDGFSGYNQIRMAEEDKIKTTFTTIEYKHRLNPAKCTFSAQSGKLLGFVVSERGIEVDPDKVKAIKELPPPSSVREVRGFLGRLNYIARFIANLTDKCQPLFRLLRKNAAIEWDEECHKAFNTIKAYLVQPPVLVPPTPGRLLILYLTVRRQSLGCMLGQEEESTHTERAIYYLSKKFTDGESNYPEIEKMCCALVWVMQRLRQYTLYHTVRFLSKADPLKYLLDSPSSTRNLAKWRCQLTEYDIEYVSRVSVKWQAIADHLAEFPIEDHTPINPDFPDEGILQVDDEGEKSGWKMYFDGAVNSMGSGIGAVLISPDGHYYPVSAKIDFPCTNNVAEYEACKAVDEDIKNLLRTGQFPPFADRRDRKTLRRLAIHYFLSGEILYRRSFDSTLLRCIDEHESRCLMEEVHEGNCGPHMNGLMLAKKIMRLGYYWSTMEIDCVKHVRHCHRCQVFADQIKAQPNELRPMMAPWPFSMWGMDVIGPINPKASNGHVHFGGD